MATNKNHILPFFHLMVSLYIVVVDAFAVQPTDSFSSTRSAGPTLTTSESELIIEGGRRFSLTCVGDQPLKWTHPSSTAAVITSSNTTGKGTNPATANTYESALLVERPIYKDTGLYTCSYGEQRQEVEPASVYVYVYDGKNLLASKAPLSVAAIERQNCTVPCKPTHPNADVFLKKSSTSPLNRNVVFDPRLGFTIVNVTEEFNAMFICEANYKGKKSIQMVLFVYIAQRAEVTQANTDIVQISSSHENALYNETVVFRCHADLNPADLWLIVSWDYPAMNDSKSASRIESGNRTRIPMVASNGDHFDRVYTNLTVRGIRALDAGAYTCRIETGSTGTSTNMFNLTVHERSYIYLTPVNSSIIRLCGKDGCDRNSNITLSVRINAYPKPTVLWTKDGVPLGSRKYVMEGENLTIFYLHWTDSGTYSLQATNGHVNTSVSINITIATQPTVTVSTRESYVVNSTARLSCQFGGYPTPSLQWMSAPCSNPSCSLSAENPNWKTLNTSRNISTEGSNKGDLFVEAIESGWYACKVENMAGSALAYARLVVTDSVNGFGLLHSSGFSVRSLMPERQGSNPTQNGISQAIEQDDVAISCAASPVLYNVTSLHWIQDDEGSRPVVSASGLDVVSHRTMRSEILTLRIQDVKVHHQGQYRCVVKTVNDTIHVINWTLSVGLIEPPSFVKGLGEAQISITTGSQQILRCEANGQPTPILEWEKDGEVLYPSENCVFNDDLTTFTLAAVNESDAGFYSCIASNRGGAIYSNLTLVWHDGSEKNSSRIIVIIVSAISALALIALILVAVKILLCKRKSKKNMRRQVTVERQEALLVDTFTKFNPDLPMDEQTKILPYDMH